MIDPLIRAKSYFTDIEILGGSLEESTWGYCRSSSRFRAQGLERVLSALGAGGRNAGYMYVKAWRNKITLDSS